MTIGTRQFAPAHAADWIRDSQLDDSDLVNERDSYARYRDMLSTEAEKRAEEEASLAAYLRWKTASASRSPAPRTQGAAERAATLPLLGTSVPETVKPAARLLQKYRDVRRDLAWGPRDKTAGVGHDAASAFRAGLGGSVPGALKTPEGIALALLGAGAGGLHTYGRSKPRAELGGHSRDEVDTATALATPPAAGASFAQRLHRRQQEFEHGLAHEFRTDPGKAALLGAGVGGTLGLTAAQLLGAVKNLATKG